MHFWLVGRLLAFSLGVVAGLDSHEQVHSFFVLIFFFSSMMCFIARSWHICYEVPFIYTDRLVILIKPVFYTSYICIFVGTSWHRVDILPWTDRLGGVIQAGVRAQTKFVRHLNHLTEGGQFPCNQKKKKKSICLMHPAITTHLGHRDQGDITPADKRCPASNIASV